MGRGTVMNVRGQHAIAGAAAQRDTVYAEHVHGVLEAVAKLRHGGVLKHLPQQRQGSR